MLELSDEEKKKILLEAVDREMQILEIVMYAKAQRTVITIEEYIKVRQMMGSTLESIREDLLADLKEGGRIFGEFRNAVKATVAGSSSRLRDQAQFAEEGVGDTSYRWVAVLINTCPDCLDRHGNVKTWEEWETEGLPRTGATVCKEHCKCVLLPADASEMQPIRREA